MPFPFVLLVRNIELFDIGDNHAMNDNFDNQRNEHINAILNLDQRLQQMLRVGWPNSWLQLNLSVGGVRALLTVDSGYANTPGGIADRLNISRTTMTGVLDRLEAEGLIVRALDPADRRSFVVSLTEAGHTLIQQIDAARREPFSQALAHLEEADLQALNQGLAALVEAMRDYPAMQKDALP
jgi:DNA-binding MarR family transcriptional regulator